MTTPPPTPPAKSSAQIELTELIDPTADSGADAVSTDQDAPAAPQPLSAAESAPDETGATIEAAGAGTASAPKQGAPQTAQESTASDSVAESVVEEVRASPEAGVEAAAETGAEVESEAATVTKEAPSPAVVPDAAGPRWNLRYLLCWSHDGRLRDVELTLGAVNIITGSSHTGKSALADLLDYTMGASECNLPGRVYDATAWVGVVWERDGTQCLICRRIPEVENKKYGTNDFHYEVGSKIAIPANAKDLAPTLGRDQMLKRFEALLGIGDVKTEVFGSESNTPVRVSFRNAMPYLLQEKGTIIDNRYLLRGLDTQQRQHLIDTLPYYLGIVDESTVQRETELRRVRAEIAAAERRQAEREQVVGRASGTARSLLREAGDAGLLASLPPEDASQQEVHAALAAAAALPADVPEAFGGDAELARLGQRERELVSRGVTLKTRAEATRRMLADAGDFLEATESQRQRLEVVEILPEAGDGVCPLCVQPLAERVEAPRAVRRAAARIRQELEEVTRERPKLDAVLAALEQERTSLAVELAATRAEIADLVRASDERERFATLDRQRVLVAGRISLYLQTAEPTGEVVAEAEALDDLRQREAALEEQINTEAKLEALTLTRSRIGALATEIASELPFEARYAGRTIDINLRTFGVSVTTARQREDMRSIGSDENVLTLHVAVLLALHRVFAERRRPVPGFLLFDQLSRPYYQPTGDDSEKEVDSTQLEVVPLRRYFDALFAEVARGEGLQVLVLEHAYFADDARFKGAVRERWVPGREGHVALIPPDWPDRQPDVSRTGESPR